MKSLLSLLVIPYLRLPCCKVTAFLNHSPNTLYTLVLPDWPEVQAEGQGSQEQQLEKQLLDASNFPTLNEMLNIFFKSTLSFPSVATWPGEIYNEFCKAILPKEADSHLSQAESGSPMNQSRKKLELCSLQVQRR